MIKGIMKRKDLIMTAIVLGAVLTLIYVRRDIALSKGSLMKEVYSRYNFDVMQINMKASNVITNTFISFEEEQHIIDSVLKQLEIEGEIYYEDEGNEFCRKRVATRNAKNSQTEIIVISEKDASENTKLKINISLYNDEGDKDKMQDLIRDIYKNYNTPSNLNITMVGTYDGKVEIEDCKGIAKNIMTSIRGEVVNEYENERLYSIYGYTNLIDEEEIVADERKTNIHLALRYNEIEDKTYLYIASPIISFDY